MRSHGVTPHQQGAHLVGSEGPEDLLDLGAEAVRAEGGEVHPQPSPKSRAESSPMSSRAASAMTVPGPKMQVAPASLSLG